MAMYGEKVKVTPAAKPVPKLKPKLWPPLTPKKSTSSKLYGAK